jgi:hypothetical protein
MNTKNRLTNSFSEEILNAYKSLIKAVNNTPEDCFFQKSYQMSGVDVSVADIIAYQIGWGELLIYWYTSGIQKIDFVMPGDGFEKWDYHAISLHFYKKYSHLSYQALLDKFDDRVHDIIQIVDYESKSGNLDKPGVWSWCSLKSGKEWPLSKWIRVNTIAPYKRAYKLIS